LCNKSNGRKVFKECGLPLPDGAEDLYSEEDIAKALYDLKKKNPSLRRSVVKVNDGFSGDGNGIFNYEKDDDYEKILKQLRQRLKMVASDLTYEVFLEKFSQMGGVVEEFIEGDIKTSPSVQCRVSPTGHVLVCSTHDQELGGDTGQVFLGAYFPAHPDYAAEIGKMGKIISENLKEKGVWGRFAIDFISVKRGKRVEALCYRDQFEKRRYYASVRHARVPDIRCV
jgi:hypothetical protein